MSESNIPIPIESYSAEQFLSYSRIIVERCFKLRVRRRNILNSTFLWCCLYFKQEVLCFDQRVRMVSQDKINQFPLIRCCKAGNWTLRSPAKPTNAREAPVKSRNFSKPASFRSPRSVHDRKVYIINYRHSKRVRSAGVNCVSSTGQETCHNSRQN